MNNKSRRGWRVMRRRDREIASKGEESKGGSRLHEIIEDNFLGPWPRLVLPCPLNFHVRGCDHLAVTCSLTLHAYVKRCLRMTNGERTGIVFVSYIRPRVSPIDSASFCIKKPAKGRRDTMTSGKSNFQGSISQCLSQVADKNVGTSMS